MILSQSQLSYTLITGIVFLLYQPLAVLNYPKIHNDELVIIKESFSVNDTQLSNLKQTGTLTLSLCESESTETDDLIVPLQFAESATEEIFTTTADSYMEQQREPQPHINMSAFLALIPAAKFKTVVNNYYQRDIQVQQAYDFLQSVEFAQLKQQLLNSTEMLDLLRFFNNSGIQLLKLVHSLGSYLTVPNENKLITEDALPAGLEAMIETLLESLPQDLILTQFFEKLEHDEQFYRLVNNIGSPEFAQICYNLQHSQEIAHFFYVLETKGVNLKWLLNTLKDYIFMGTF